MNFLHCICSIHRRLWKEPGRQVGLHLVMKLQMMVLFCSCFMGMSTRKTSTSGHKTVDDSALLFLLQRSGKNHRIRLAECVDCYNNSYLYLYVSKIIKRMIIHFRGQGRIPREPLIVAMKLKPWKHTNILDPVLTTWTLGSNSQCNVFFGYYLRADILLQKMFNTICLIVVSAVRIVSNSKSGAWSSFSELGQAHYK